MRTLIQIRVSPYEKRRLQEVAEQNGQTLSDFLRDAINDAVADCSENSDVLRLRNK